MINFRYRKRGGIICHWAFRICGPKTCGEKVVETAEEGRGGGGEKQGKRLEPAPCEHTELTDGPTPRESTKSGGG